MTNYGAWTGFTEANFQARLEQCVCVRWKIGGRVFQAEELAKGTERGVRIWTCREW